MVSTRRAPAGTVDDTVRLDTLDSLLRLGMGLRRHVEAVARDFGLSAPQARLVITLAEPMRMQQAADATACEPSHLTALADQLESAGLLTRAADPEDRRARLLGLTAKGRRLRGRLLPAVVTGAPVVGQLDHGECTALRALIERSGPA